MARVCPRPEAAANGTGRDAARGIPASGEAHPVCCGRTDGIPLNRLNEIVRGRRAITADTALRLGRLFKMSPEFWMAVQADWDLWHAAHAAGKRAEAEIGSGLTKVVK